MASNQSDVQRYRSPPPSPSPPASLSLSDRSGHSTSSACRVCWRPSCQLGTHRDYAKRAALPPARTIAVARQPSKEHVSNFPIEMKANMRQLYNHFFTVEIPRQEVIPHPTGVSTNRALSQKYSSLAETCPSLCYSIVSYAASRIASSQGVVDDRALKHYAQGVRSLAEAVNGPATESVTLAALTLLHHDLTFFYADAIDTHIQGIYTMIEKQGGLAYLDGTIGQVVFSCDYQSSVLLDRLPKYRHPSLTDARPMNLPEIQTGQAFKACRVWALVDPRLQEAIQDVGLMVAILEHSRRVPITMGDYQFFGYKRNVVQNILGFMHAEFSASGTFNECLCLGIILFQSMTIGGIDTINGIFDHLIPKFKIAIGEVHVKLNKLWATEAGMAVWLMFIGMAIPDIYKRFRNEFLEKVCKILEATYGQDLVNCKARVQAGLSMYIWCDLMLSKRFNKIWNEIMSKSAQQTLATADSESHDDAGDDDGDDQAAAATAGSIPTGPAVPGSASNVLGER